MLLAVSLAEVGSGFLWVRAVTASAAPCPGNRRVDLSRALPEPPQTPDYETSDVLDRPSYADARGIQLNVANIQRWRKQIDHGLEASKETAGQCAQVITTAKDDRCQGIALD